jgi:hypothetical protein
MGRHFLLIQSVLVFATNDSPSSAALVPVPVSTGPLLTLRFVLLVPVDPMLFEVDEPNPPELDPNAPAPELELLPKPLVADIVVAEPKPALEPNPPDVDEPNVEDPLDEMVVVVVDALHVLPVVVVDATKFVPNVLVDGKAATEGSLASAS